MIRIKTPDHINPSNATLPQSDNSNSTNTNASTGNHASAPAKTTNSPLTEGENKLYFPKDAEAPEGPAKNYLTQTQATVENGKE